MEFMLGWHQIDAGRGVQVDDTSQVVGLAINTLNVNTRHLRSVLSI